LIKGGDKPIANPVAGSSTIASDARPSLLPFVRLQRDEVRERWVLQAPERVLVLDDSGRAILECCDGTAAVASIVDRLASEYDAPREVIEHDVHAVLTLLADKGFLSLGEPGAGG
jgi:pyrroloquinoline quinone biosynthesis protein D